MYHYIRTRLQSLATDERGASAVEYGLLVSLIAIVMIGGVILVGQELLALFNDVAANL